MKTYRLRRGTYSLFAILILISLNSCFTSYKSVTSEVSYEKVDKKLDTASAKIIDSLVNPYKTGLDKIMNEVIGYSDGLSISKPESTLGNWAADVMEESAKKLSGSDISFAALNHGGIRIREIPEGPVTVSKIYELMPFENYITIIKADGNIIKQFLDRIAKYGGWPVSNSLSFRIEGDTAQDIMIDGKAFDLNSGYTIAIPDYVANGGDDCFFFDQVPKQNTDQLIRNILIDEVKNLSAKNEHLKAKIEGRIK